jgi:hypothetical protein
LRKSAELLVQPRLDLLKLLISCLATIPGLEGNKIKGAVAGANGIEQAEANDAVVILNSGCGPQDLFDFSRCRGRSFNRCRIGKLQINEKLTRVFIGQKA